MEPAGDPAVQPGGAESPQEPEAPPAFHIPAAIKASDAMWLIRQGVEPALKYRDHFGLSITAPTEQVDELATLRRKISNVLSMPVAAQADYSADLAGWQAAEAALCVQLGGSCDAEAASADAVPGAEPRQLSRLHAILGRHLTMAAAEEAALAGHIVDLEAQAIEVQAQIASAHRQSAHQHAANLELEKALRGEIEGLNTATRPVLQAVAAITEREAFAAVEAKLGERMSPTWCAQNGMGGMTVQAASAIFQQLIEATRELDQA